MRTTPERILSAALAVFALAGVVAAVLNGSPDSMPAGRRSVHPMPRIVGREAPEDAEAWFQSTRPFCNTVEVETQLRGRPAPATTQGDMYRAACYALAGRVDRAREVIEGLPEAQRYLAAGVVFDAGHPAADAGGDIAAGPLMELVVDYWPNHYMALYHAGAARFQAGSHAVASGYLERFLAEYSTDDGWRRSALSMLEQISGR
jgi:hypothetical protein